MLKIPLPAWAIRNAYRIFDVESSGEAAVVDNRLHEYAFVLSEITKMKPGKILDVGCAARINVVPPFASCMGWRVYGLDNREWSYEHDNFEMLTQDVNDTLPECEYDAVVLLSTIEHVGFAGRYGIRKQDDQADVKAMQNLFQATKLGGTLLLTAPFTLSDKTSRPLSRVYNTASLQHLLNDWCIQTVAVTPDKSTVLLKAVRN